MKSYPTLICFAVFYLLRGFSFGQESSDLLDLNQVAEILKFPRSQLVISDYLETEKAAYTKRTASENESNQASLVDANSIYKSYLITSKTKNTFLPIIVTLSKPDAYLTPKVKKLVDDFESYAEAERSKGNFFPYGKFDLTGSFKGALFHEQIRVIADLDETSEPQDTSTWVGKYVTKIPAIVSIGRGNSSKVDIRITQQTCFSNPDPLIKIDGGEDYFAAFNDDPQDDPKQTPILDMFKGLNQIVLTSSMMAYYRENLEPPPVKNELQKEEIGKPNLPSSGPKNLPKIPNVLNSVIIQMNPQGIIVLVLLVAGILVILLRLRKARR